MSDHVLADRPPTEAERERAERAELLRRADRPDEPGLTPAEATRRLVRERWAPAGAAPDYLGVYRHKQGWRAILEVRRGTWKVVGKCETKLQAARLYDRAARKHLGPDARLNFPDREPALPTPETEPTADPAAPAGPDLELDLIARLARLDPAARRRVLAWARDRYPER
jgi:hypothetical protein